MSQRSMLKKKIYKLKQDGKDTSILEKQLSKIKLSPEQVLHQIRTAIIRDIHTNNIELEEKYKNLCKEVYGKKWVLPYRIKYLLNQRYSYLGDKVSDDLSLFMPKTVEIKSIDKNQRFIVLLVNNERMRINVETKQAFSSKTFFK